MNLEKLLQQIYVIHYEPLSERRQRIDSSLRKIQGVPINYVMMNPETDKVISGRTHSIYRGSSKISFQEIAVSVAHLNVFKDIIKNKYEKCLVIEDDAILEDIFFNNIVNAIHESNEFDFSFLSSGCNLHAVRKRTGLLQESDSSRTVCGYIVNSQCLEKVISHCEPFEYVIDWQLNHIKQELRLRYAWSEPPIVGQGSEKEYMSNLHHLRKNR